VALYVLQEEKELMRRLEKGIGFPVEMRDDPLLKPDDFKLVVKGAGRDITGQYAMA
jgi:ribonuclease G